MNKKQVQQELTMCLEKYYPDIKVNIYNFGDEFCAADLVSESFADSPDVGWTSHVKQVLGYLQADIPEVYFGRLWALLPVTQEMFENRIE